MKVVRIMKTFKWIVWFVMFTFLIAQTAIYLTPVLVWMYHDKPIPEWQPLCNWKMVLVFIVSFVTLVKWICMGSDMIIAGVMQGEKDR